MEIQAPRFVTLDDAADLIFGFFVGFALARLAKRIKALEDAQPKAK